MPVLAAHHLKKSFVERLLFSDVTFEINEKDKVGLVGVNGCGKTTLFRILLGQEQPDEGSVYKNRGMRVVSMAQSIEDTEQSVYDATLAVFAPLMELEAAMEQVNAALEHAEENELDALIRRQHSLRERYEDGGGLTFRSRTRAALLGLGFTEEELSKPLSIMSGGERNKAQLARVLLAGANLLLLDEPTNHLDIASREALERALEEYDGTMLIVTHDRYLADRLADRILYMTGEGVEEYIGGYTEFLSERARRAALAAERTPAAPEQEDAAAAPKQNDYRARKERQSALNRAAGEVRRAEERIAAAEEEITALEAELALPEVASDYKKAGELSRTVDEKRQALETLYQKWEEAQARLEELEGE